MERNKDNIVLYLFKANNHNVIVQKGKHFNWYKNNIN